MNFSFIKNIISSIYTKLFIKFILLVIIPTFIISTMLFSNLSKQNELLALDSINQISSQVEANITAQMKYIEDVYKNLSSTNYLTTFLNAKYHNSIDFPHYSNTIFPFVLGSTGLDYRNSLQIFMTNTSIPEGFGIFFKLSTISKNATIKSFIEGAEATTFLLPSNFSTTPTSFTMENNSLIYLAKIYNGQKLTAIIKIIVPESSLWNNQDEYKLILNLDTRILDYTQNKIAQYLTYPAQGTSTMDGTCYKYLNLPKLPLSILLVSDLPPAADQAKLINILWIAAIILAMGIMLKTLFSWTRRIYRCLDQMNTSIQTGFTLRLPSKGTDEIAKISANINVLLDKIKELMTTAVEQEKLSKETQIHALQNQINPHFIYNTMELFSSQMELYSHFDESEAMSDFAKMLRYNINGTEPFASLDEELSHIKSYLNIQRIRYPGISYTMDIPKELYHHKVLRFLLQPFVENSIKHGINRFSPKLHIYISARLTENNELLFTIYDNGIGMDKAAINEINHRLHKNIKSSTSIGIDNINRRLKLFFGDEYKIEVFSKKSQWTMVTFAVPL